MAKLKEKVCYVVLDGEAACLVYMLCSVVPFDANASKLGTLLVFRDLVMFLQDLAGMVSVLFTHIFNPTVIHDRAKSDRKPGVLSNPWGYCSLKIACLIELYSK